MAINPNKTRTVPVNWPLTLHAKIMAYAIDDKRSFANMVKLLCTEAIEARIHAEKSEQEDQAALQHLRKQQQQIAPQTTRASSPQTPRYKPVQQPGREEVVPAQLQKNYNHEPKPLPPNPKPATQNKPSANMPSAKLTDFENDKKLDAIRKKPKYGGTVK